MKSRYCLSIIKPVTGSIAAIVLFVLVSAATAQTAQNATRPDRGTHPNGSYSVSDIENISLTNGNLNLSIPLANLPPVAGGKLSWVVRAIYNSKTWDVKRDDVTTESFPPLTYAKDGLQQSLNGGWRIGGAYSITLRSFTSYEYGWNGPNTGDIDQAFFVQNPPINWTKVELTTPDGATHELRPVDFTPYQSSNRPFLWGYYIQRPDVNGAMRYYSFDGSFIWAKINPTSSSTKWELYLPDGTRVIQTASFQRIQDSNGVSPQNPDGNSIKIFTQTDPNTGLLTTYYRDENATDSDAREIRQFFNPSTNTEQIQYQTVGGTWVTIDVVWGTTTVRGQTYPVQDHTTSSGIGSPLCTRTDLLGPIDLSVVRDIVLPQTEPGLARKKFTFGYNSDTTEPVSGVTWQFDCEPGTPQLPVTSSSIGWGSLSRMVTPSGAEANYTYSNNSNHQLLDINETAREIMTRKSITHDGTTDAWNYSIGFGQGSVSGPDGSTTQEFFYSHDPAFSASYGGSDGLGGMVYKTIRSGIEIIERRWALKKFSGGSDLVPGGPNSKPPFNAVVAEEYRTLVGNPSKVSAKTFQYDFNGNLIKETQYDWFDPTSVTREGGTANLPLGVPASAVKLREVNYIYHSQADAAGSTNVYAKRVMGTGSNPPTPLILNAVKETTTGIGTTILSKTRFHYDNQGFNALPVRGNVTLVQRDLNGTWVETSYTYDPVFFNKLTERDPRGNTTQYSYLDTTNAQPTRIQVDPNPLVAGDELTTEMEYDYFTGLPKSQKDPNQQVTMTDYTNQLLGTVDPYGRPGKVTGPMVTSFVDGSTFTNEQRTVVTKYFDDARRIETISDLNRKDDGKLRSRASADQLGRSVKTEMSEDGGVSYGISSETIYKYKPGGANGSVIKTRNAHRPTTDSTDGWTRTRNDVLGRIIEVATFSGGSEPPDTGTNTNWTGSVTTDYNGIYTTVTDQALKVRRSVIDGAGRLVRVDEPNDSGSLGTVASPVQPTFYTYDALGNLVNVTQNSPQGNQTRTYTYDSLSRLKTAKNPEQVNGSGVQQETRYEYDEASNLITRTNPDLSNVTFTYDGMNRVKTKTLSTGGLWIYSYDSGPNGKGRLASVVRQGSTDGTYYDGYDAAGRLLASRQITDSNIYTMSYSYDLAGNITRQVYPSGREVRTVYDPAGRLSKVSRFIGGSFDKDYTSGFLYTPAGAMGQMMLGNGLRETMSYNSRLQPLTIELRRASNTELILGLDYGYGTTSNNGNVLTQGIRIGQGGSTTTISQSYGYDSLNRLTSASESVSWSQNYGYDRFGNRWVSSSIGYATDPTLTPTSPSAHIDAKTNRLKMAGMTYDPLGNLKAQTRNGVTETMNYDSENRMTSHVRSGLTTSYVYDGDGRRVKKVVGTATTLYVYNATGQLVAEYTNPDAVIEGGGGTSYLTSDHLGSTRIVTNSTGGVKARHDYLPFGEELGSSTGVRTFGMGYSQSDGLKQKFTGKERDAESGMDYFLARYYSSAQGRFTSLDPVALTVGRLTDPQQINLYAYTRNNPLAFIDPTGEIIAFADKEAREKFENYEKFLNTDTKKYAAELNTLNQLKNSEVEYQINVGGNFAEGAEGNLTSDGSRVFVSISNVGGPSGEVFSLNSRFAHELEHARQFENGEFAFVRNQAGEWNPSRTNYDIGDEVKAWKVQQNASTDSDYFQSKSGRQEPSTLSKFSRAKTDDERAGVLVRNGYPNRNPNRDSNVRFSASEGYKPGQLIRPSDRPNFFGRVHK
jgi:RHS repeat-associated protein